MRKMSRNSKYCAYLREELVDNCVAYASPIIGAPTLLENSVQLVKDDDMKTTLIALLLVFLLSVSEELANVLFGSTDELAQDLRAVDDLRFSCIEHLSDLSGDEGFTRSRRSMKNDTWKVC